MTLSLLQLKPAAAAAAQALLLTLPLTPSLRLVQLTTLAATPTSSPLLVQQLLFLLRVAPLSLSPLVGLFLLL